MSAKAPASHQFLGRPLDDSLPVVQPDANGIAGSHHFDSGAVALSVSSFSPVNTPASWEINRAAPAHAAWIKLCSWVPGHQTRAYPPRASCGVAVAACCDAPIRRRQLARSERESTPPSDVTRKSTRPSGLRLSGGDSRIPPPAPGSRMLT